MAEITKQALKVDNNSSFPNNNAGAITPAILRAFNVNMIDSMVDEIGYTADSASWNVSISNINAFTASAQSLTTASLLITASAQPNSNVITFTKGNGSTFNVTVATGSIPDISNLNQATASLQAFTQSAQVSINNLNTTTASLNTSVSNINTFTASTAISITNLNASSASQQVSIDSLNSKTGSYATTGSNTFVSANTFTSISASSFVSASQFVGDGSKLTNITASIALPILDEGIPQGNAFSMNFTGSAISATVVGGTAVVSVNVPDTGSFNSLTASFNAYTASTNSDLNAIHQATASLQTNSASVNISITNLNASSASQQVSIDALNTNSASVNTSISALNTFTASQSTASLVTSITNLNTFSASALVSISNINSTTASLLVETQNLELFSASALISISNLNASSASQQISIDNLNTNSASVNTSITNINSATASLNTSASLALVTASFDTGTRNLTFTKGNTTQFSVNIPDVSGSAGTFVTTSSFNAYTQSNDQRVTALEVNSASVNTSITNINSTTASLNISVSALNTFTASQSTASLVTSIDNLNTFSASALVSISNLNTTTQSLNTSVTNLNSATASLFGSASLSLYTASAVGNTITFTKGDTSTFSVSLVAAPIDTGSFATTASFNAYTSSNDAKVNSLIAATGSFVTTSSFNTYTSSQSTASLVTSITELNTFSASALISLSNLNTATASLFTSTSLSLTTASFSGNTLTFTKGDASTFGVVIPDVSGSAGTTVIEVVYTGESITKGDPLYISGSQGANPVVFKADASNPAKMPVTFISNETIGAANTTNAIVLGLIEGIDLTGYVAGQTIYVGEGGGYSTNLPSGSNSITQLLGVITKGGTGGKGLVLNPGPAQLPGLDTGYMWVGGATNQPIEITTASFASSASFNTYTSSTNSRLNNIETTTASLLIETANLETFSASALISISNLNTATASLFTSTSLNLKTASVNLNTITFTKGDNSTFALTVDTGSGGGGAAFPFVGDAVITGSLTVSGSTVPDIRLIGNIDVTGSLRGQPITLSVASSTASLNMTEGNNFILTLPSSSTTHINATNIVPGQTLNLLIKQQIGPATGSITFAPTIFFPSGVDMQATATGSAIDLVSMISFDTTNLMAANVKNLK